MQTIYQTSLNLLRSVTGRLLTLARLLLILYAIGAVCRVAYWAENASALGGTDTLFNLKAWQGAFTFDTSALLYVNLLWFALWLFLPCRWWRAKRATFVLLNLVAVAVNLCDAVYFPFTQQRTTCNVFQEFSAEGNLGRIFLVEALHHWYLILLFLAIGFALWKGYGRGESDRQTSWKTSCASGLIVLLLSLYPIICGIRGGAGSHVRPITLSNAMQYVERPSQAAFVLNTPFTMIRTSGHTMRLTRYFSDEECEAIFSPLHQPSDSLAHRRMNVVVMILESFGREYMGVYNDGKGFTPFLDSLTHHALHFPNAFANGRKSIDAMPSILSSLPMFGQPIFTSPYAAADNFSGLARILGKEGYQSTFYHGAPNGSMGFEAFACATNFARYVGMDEYVAEKGNSDASDGTWAIWDEEFLQFMVSDMERIDTPFVAAVFTASSHHPFRIPKRYEGQFPKGTQPIHQCIGYSDMALRRFFERASRQPWFYNTLFVLTADHTNQTANPFYETELGRMRVPIIFYAPGDTSLTGACDMVAQQTDIMPTVLSYLHNHSPYVSFGKDLLSTSPSEAWAAHEISGTRHYVTDSLLLQFADDTPRALYRWRTDSLLQHNLLGQVPADSLERNLKAVIQQYMERLRTNRMVP